MSLLDKMGFLTETLRKEHCGRIMVAMTIMTRGNASRHSAVPFSGSQWRNVCSCSFLRAQLPCDCDKIICLRVGFSCTARVDSLCRTKLRDVDCLFNSRGSARGKRITQCPEVEYPSPTTGWSSPCRTAIPIFCECVSSLPLCLSAHCVSNRAGDGWRWSNHGLGHRSNHRAGISKSFGTLV